MDEESRQQKVSRLALQYAKLSDGQVVKVREVPSDKVEDPIETDNALEQEADEKEEENAGRTWTMQ